MVGYINLVDDYPASALQGAEPVIGGSMFCMDFAPTLEQDLIEIWWLVPPTCPTGWVAKVDA